MLQICFLFLQCNHCEWEHRKNPQIMTISGHWMWTMAKKYKSVKHQTVSLRHSFSEAREEKNLNEITYMFIAHIPGNWRKMCWNQYFSSLVFLRKSFGLISIFYRAWNHILKHKSWLTLFFGCKIHTRSESRHTHTKDDKFHSWKMAKYAEREKLHKNASWCIFRVSLFQ